MSPCVGPPSRRPPGLPPRRASSAIAGPLRQQIFGTRARKQQCGQHPSGASGTSFAIVRPASNT
eukprot:12425487-Alexandrium_andersonii.AAC.1